MEPLGALAAAVAAVAAAGRDRLSALSGASRGGCAAVALLAAALALFAWQLRARRQPAAAAGDLAAAGRCAADASALQGQEMPEGVSRMRRVTSSALLRHTSMDGRPAPAGAGDPVEALPQLPIVGARGDPLSRSGSAAAGACGGAGGAGGVGAQQTQSTVDHAALAALGFADVVVGVSASRNDDGTRNEDGGDCFSLAHRPPLRRDQSSSSFQLSGQARGMPRRATRTSVDMGRSSVMDGGDALRAPRARSLLTEGLAMHCSAAAEALPPPVALLPLPVPAPGVEPEAARTAPVAVPAALPSVSASWASRARRLSSSSMGAAGLPALNSLFQDALAASPSRLGDGDVPRRSLASRAPSGGLLEGSRLRGRGPAPSPACSTPRRLSGAIDGAVAAAAAAMAAAPGPPDGRVIDAWTARARASQNVLDRALCAAEALAAAFIAHRLGAAAFATLSARSQLPLIEFCALAAVATVGAPLAHLAALIASPDAAVRARLRIWALRTAGACTLLRAAHIALDPRSLQASLHHLEGLATFWSMARACPSPRPHRSTAHPALAAHQQQQQQPKTNPCAAARERRWACRPAAPRCCSPSSPLSG